MTFDRLHASLNPMASQASPLVEARFIPRQYEPNYPYPLLVLFHARGGDEEQFVRAQGPSEEAVHRIQLSVVQPLGLGTAASRGEELELEWGSAPVDNPNQLDLLRSSESK